jgi:peptide/nickel transport system ATP-binding protein
MKALSGADAAAAPGVSAHAPAPPLLSVDGLRTVVRHPEGDVVVVDGVGLDLAPNETVALVGESGSGKSITALSIARLLGRRLATVAGSVRLDGRELLTMRESEFRALRGREIGIVFQEPMTSLNPILSIGLQLTEALHHAPADGRSARARAAELLDRVGIPEPERRLRMYPHQLSGGMRQRVMVAIALAGHPRVLIADEPTTALDVTTQAQILELIAQQQRALGAGMLLITHDMGVVARYARRVNVMYAGTIVERGPAAALFADPRHPYTRGLLRSIPRLDRPRVGRLPAIEGLPPAPGRRPTGCPFRPRCAHAMPKCESVPPLVSVGPGRESACWFAAELPPFSEATHEPVRRVAQ